MQPNCSSIHSPQIYLRFLTFLDDIQNLQSNHQIDHQSKLYQSQPIPLARKKKVRQKSSHQHKQKVFRISRQITLPDSQQYGKQKVKIKRVRNRQQKECSLNEQKININFSCEPFYTSPPCFNEYLMVQKDPSQLEDIEVIQMRNESDKDEFQIAEVMEVKYLGDQFQKMQIREDHALQEVSQNVKELKQFRYNQNIQEDHQQSIHIFECLL